MADKIDRTQPHFRLYNHRTDGVTVVCVQDFDYPDYDQNCFLPGEWLTEVEAEAALADREYVVPHIGHLNPHAMAADLFPSAIAAAESRGRAAGYAEAVARVRQLATTNGPLFTPNMVADFLAEASRATTEETPR